MIDSIASAIKEAKSTVVFTGAGISAESGIPTYRGEGGLWTKYDPEKYANIDYFYHDPSYYWSFFKEVRYPILKEARPNKGHIALAILERNRKLDVIITQNIDGLHQEAGSKNVIELHGNTRRFYCIGCNQGYTMQEAYFLCQERLPPGCSRCGGLLRPDVVFFGESLPQVALQEAMGYAQRCNLFLSIGSSLVVFPAAQIPLIAKQNGAKLIIINKGSTPLDEVADCVLDASAGETLAGVQRYLNL
jgi:NAD-dependent deacetylase